MASQFDRSAITKAAWAARREAVKAAADWDLRFTEMLCREYQPRLNAAATDEARELITTRARHNFIQFVAGPRPNVSTWAECMRHAWTDAKRDLQPVKPVSEFEERRVAAQFIDDAGHYAAIMAQIARDQAAFASSHA